MNDLEKVVQEVADEVRAASALFPPPVGPHEALGIILEEFEEFKAEVMKFNPRKGRDTRPEMCAELKQLAAMAIRAMMSVCGGVE